MVPCSGNVALNGTSGFIDDGYEPTYPDNLFCNWTITPLINGVPAGVPFNLTFSKIDLEFNCGECNIWTADLSN